MTSWTLFRVVRPRFDDEIKLDEGKPFFVRKTLHSFFPQYHNEQPNRVVFDQSVLCYSVVLGSEVCARTAVCVLVFSDFFCSRDLCRNISDLRSINFFPIIIVIQTNDDIGIVNILWKYKSTSQREEDLSFKVRIVVKIKNINEFKVSQIVLIIPLGAGSRKLWVPRNTKWSTLVSTICAFPSAWRV